MTQVEEVYSVLIDNGFGQYSRDITLDLMSLLNNITKAKDEFKPQDTQFVLNVKPNTKVTVTVTTL